MTHRSVVAVLIVLGMASPALACKLVLVPPQTTLREEFAQAKVVLYVSPVAARKDKDGHGNPKEGGSTDLKIEQVLKTHPILGTAKLIEIDRSIPPDPQKTRYLIFCDVYKGKLDPYRGVPATPAVIKYLQGAAALNPQKQRAEAMLYAFRHLEHEDRIIADDALQEFAKGTSQPDTRDFDYRFLAGRLPAREIASRLQDRNTPSYRVDRYAVLLGHCGGDQDARLLRRLIDGRRANGAPDIFGPLVGYTLLKPREGWVCVTCLLCSPNEDFRHRHAALRAARFFWSTRPDVIGRKDVLEGIRPLLAQPDIADIPIEDLRHWRAWTVSDEVLSFWELKSHQVPIIRRAIVRYALCCPKPAALALVYQLRQMDPDLVKDQEELLKLEGTRRDAEVAAEAIEAILTLWP